MRRSIKTKRTLVFPGAAFVLLVLLVHFGVTTEKERLRQNFRTHVVYEILNHLSRLEGELNANVSLANGMVAHIVAQDGHIEGTAEQALKALHQYGKHIRNIGIAPDNRISHVYPLSGNERAIGLYYPDIGDQWPAVKKAIETRTTILAGPVSLRQGGTGLASRTPVFLPDGRYWGVISIVLDSDELFRSVGLLGEDDGIRYALRGRNGTGAEGEVFLGDAGLFGPDSVAYPVAVPGGTWQLAASPVQGWNPPEAKLLAGEILGFVLALSIALALHGYQESRRRVADNERRLRAFLDTTCDGVIAVDDRGMVLEFNAGAEALFGYSAEEILGRSLTVLMPPGDAAVHDHYVAASQGDGNRVMAAGRQVNGVKKSGEEFPVEITVGKTWIGGKRIHVGVVRDITERKAFERKLLELATTDPLTGILNRRAFMETAEKSFQLAKRHKRPLSLLMIDADRFKHINDRFGHHIGDRVLVNLVGLVKASLRITDCFGRFGGEEFIVLLPETDCDQAADVSRRLLSLIRSSELAADDGSSVRFTVSIGIGTVSPDLVDVEELIRLADAALYRAKASGRDRWCGPGESNA